MGLPVPASMEGMDLSGHALSGYATGTDPGNRPSKEEPREEEPPRKEAALMQGMGHTYQWEDGDEWRAVRSRRYTYAKMLADGQEYLFDHVEDPYQRDNLAGDPDYTEPRERLEATMHEKMEALGDPFKPTTWHRGRWVKDREIIRTATQTLEDNKPDA
jgi:hypothetical protein